MSVTELAKHPGFAARLREIYPALQIRPTDLLKVPRSSAPPSTVGIAFDYLFRIILARRVGMRAPHLRWAADQAPDNIDCAHELSDRETCLDIQAWCRDALAQAKAETARFHRTGAVTDDLVWSIYAMSLMEPLARVAPGRRVNLDLKAMLERNHDAVSELRALLDLVDFKGHNIGQHLYLAPALPAAAAVGGGEPDLIMDGWMCELKVVTEMRDSARWADQLIMYCALAAAGGVDMRSSDSWMSASHGGGPSVVNGIAVYFARHGQWVPIRITDVINPAQLSAVTKLMAMVSRA
jgi:hypothetical protein